MELISGITKEDFSDYIIYFIEDLSDELKQEIRNRLVAVCHGADQAQSLLKVYFYRETVKEFVKRYKTNKDASEDRKKCIVCCCRANKYCKKKRPDLSVLLYRHPRKTTDRLFLRFEGTAGKGKRNSAAA